MIWMLHEGVSQQALIMDWANMYIYIYIYDTPSIEMFWALGYECATTI